MMIPSIISIQPFLIPNRDSFGLRRRLRLLEAMQQGFETGLAPFLSPMDPDKTTFRGAGFKSGQ